MKDGEDASDRRRPPEEQGGTKQKRRRLMAEPPKGLTRKANAGRGDCLPLSVSDYTDRHMDKKVSALRVRNLAVGTMRKHSSTTNSSGIEWHLLPSRRSLKVGSRSILTKWRVEHQPRRQELTWEHWRYQPLRVKWISQFWFIRLH